MSLSHQISKFITHLTCVNPMNLKQRNQRKWIFLTISQKHDAAGNLFGTTHSNCIHRIFIENLVVIIKIRLPLKVGNYRFK